jgi:hypothetical protein
MQTIITHDVQVDADSPRPRVYLATQAHGEMGEVELTVYLTPSEAEAPPPDAAARKAWADDAVALLQRAGHNLCDVLDYAAAYFRAHPNDTMGYLSVAAFAEWRGTGRVVRTRPEDGTKESKGYNPHTLQAFRDALTLLGRLRVRMTVTYRPAPGKRPITVTDEGVLYHTDPVTTRDARSGRTLSTGYRLYAGPIVQRLRQIGQYMSLPMPVLALDGRYHGGAKAIARYIVMRHRITGRPSGTIPWPVALAVGGATRTARHDPTRTRERVAAGLRHMEAQGGFSALRITGRGIEYTLGPTHPARPPARGARRRGVRRVVRVLPATRR